MTTESLVSPTTNPVSPSDKRSMTNILVNLEKMGIDPEPYFILAARDFEGRLGENAGEKARQLYVDATIAGDADSAGIWERIYLIISGNSQNSFKNIH